jgi:hypothetical protein
MAEWTAISGGGGFDYVQTSAPSGAEAGETWLDTGVNPPEKKIYNGTEWLIQPSRIRFSLAPESISSTQRQKLIDNLNQLVNSKTTMENVFASPTVTDEVLNSSTAMNAVLNSSTAMRALSKSKTAMNAVSDSSTAVNSVAGSPVAWGIFLSSTHVIDSFWSNPTADGFWTYNNNVTVNGGDNQYGGPALFLPSGTSDVASWDVDADQISQIDVTERTDDFRTSSNEFNIRFSGDTLFSTTDGNTTYKTRSVSVSAYSGTHTLELLISGSAGDEGNTLVSDITTA